jgi:hypothetical protein
MDGLKQRSNLKMNEMMTWKRIYHIDDQALG